MEKFWTKVMADFREYRNKKFSNIGKFFLKMGISANLMTGISFLLGLGAVYFLFTNYWLFLILGILHLLADGLDGVIARASQETKLGKHLDHFSDRIIELLLLIKIYLYLQDYYVLIVIALFILAQTIYFLSKYTSYILFTRMTLLIILSFNFLNNTYLNILFNIPTIAYLVTGIAALYSLVRQGEEYFLKKFIK